MHVDPEFLAEIGETFVALDFTAENAEIAELETERARIASARDRASKRRDEIGQLKRDHQADGSAVADALLAEIDTIGAAAISPSIERLTEESEALRAALRDLAERDRALIERQRQIRLSCQRRAADAAIPLAEALEHDLREAAARVLSLAGGFLALRGLSPPQALVNAAEEAVQAIAGPGLLAPHAANLPMPEGLAKSLAGLTGKGDAFKYVVRPAVAPGPSFSPYAIAARR